jgi:bifunctional DNA-binding transcriptional regulator/antitoxin component of YhaV-PrlF toxin-antitoxin module
MPIEKTYKIRKATKTGNLAEISIPTEWREYHGLKYGDKIKMFVDSVLVVLPNDDKETEDKVRAFLEGNLSPSSTNTTE